MVLCGTTESSYFTKVLCNGTTIRFSKKTCCRRKGVQESLRKPWMFSRKMIIPLTREKFCREAGGQAFWII